jgi:hypothetical protein
VRSYGSDRVRVRDDGAIVLACRIAKHEWQPRRPKTLTTSEHPGTPVLWDGECYEVLEIEVLANGVGYTLGPWSDSHTMRAPSTYDAASERRRAADLRDVAVRRKGQRAATLFGFLTGHLPAAVQQQLANETGSNAPLLTMVSAFPEVLPAVYMLHRMVAARLGMQVALQLPFAVVLLFDYMAIDAAIRFGWAFLNGTPIGSVFGILGYTIYYALSPNRAKRISPMKPPPGEGTFTAEVPADVQELDALRVREPLFTLLSTAEQERIAQRWGYDYRQTAPVVAWGILLFAILGVVTSLQTFNETPRISALLSLITAGYLAVEQIVRLTILSTRPAGSILGVAARPLARRFLNE